MVADTTIDITIGASMMNSTRKSATEEMQMKLHVILPAKWQDARSPMDQKAL